jgi:hypothetical protein
MSPYLLSDNRSLDPTVDHHPPRASLRWGMAWGLWFATAYAAFAVFLALMRGTTWHHGVGLSTWQIVGIYYVVGVAAGIVLGLVRPLTGSRVGTFAIGVVAAAVCYAGFVLATVGLGWLARTIAYIPAVIGGAGLALVIYGEEHMDRDPVSRAGGIGGALRVLMGNERMLMAFIMFAAMALIGAGHLMGW